MRRVLPALLPLVLVVACGGGGPAPLPTASVHTGFPPRGIADLIVIDATDRLPLRLAELIAPDGTATPASTIDVNPSPRRDGGQRVVGDPWRGSLPEDGNVAMNAAQGGGFAAPAVLSQSQLLITLSSASIPLPDPIAYRRDWARYRIRLGFGTPPDAVETRELPAPEPLPPG